MTIAKTVRRVQYSGDGSTVAFAYAYRFFADSDLKVYVLSADGLTETLKTLTTDYTVTNNGDETGGTVTFGAAPASGETVTILSDVPDTQSTDYAANDPFPAETHEAALDRLTVLVQQLEERLGRALTAPASNSASVDLPLDRASKYLAFDASNNPVALAGANADPDAAQKAANETITGNWTFPGTLTVTGTLTMPDGTVATAKLAAGAVTTAKITDGNVTLAKIASADRPTGADLTGDTTKLVVRSAVESNLHGTPLSAGTISGSPSFATMAAFDGNRFSCYRIRLRNIVPGTDGAQLALQTSVDGSTFDTGSSDYVAIRQTIVPGAARTPVGGAVSAIQMTESGATDGVGTAAGELGVSGHIDIFGAHDGGEVRVSWDLMYERATDGALVRSVGAGRRDAAAVVLGARVGFTSGTIASGTYELIGYRSAA